MNGYGQIFLLLLAIFLILLGASGKGKAVWDALRGTTGSANPAGYTDGSQPWKNPAIQNPDITKPGNNADKAGSGNGGVMA